MLRNTKVGSTQFAELVIGVGFWIISERQGDNAPQANKKLLICMILGILDRRHPKPDGREL